MTSALTPRPAAELANRPSVLVPRGGEPGDRLAAAITAAGFVARIVPLITFVPPDDPTALHEGLQDMAASSFDWLILTSERTVDALLAHTTQPLGDLCAPLQVAAVGPSTARRAAEAGIRVDVIPEWEKSARGLIQTLTAGNANAPAHATESTASTATTATAATNAPRAFVPHSNIARPELGVGLRAAGWQVTEADAYRTVTATTLPDDARDVDVVLLTSSSTANTWAALRRPDHDALLVSIGPRTTETALELGLPIAGTAPEPTVASLTDTLTSLVHLLPTHRRH